MKLAWTRDAIGLKPVMKSPDSQGPEIAYWVFNQLSRSGWENMTIIAPGSYGGEYNKTYGHYHTEEVNEVYHLVSGEGMLILQKKHVEGGLWTPEKIDEFLLVKVTSGEEVLITMEYGHAWINIGETPLVAYDNLRATNCHDYKSIEKMRGLAYYIIEREGKLVLEENPNYKNHPAPQWLSAEEFVIKRSLNSK